MRLALRIGLGVLVILAILTLAISSRGSYERISLTPGETPDASVRATCLSQRPRRDRRLIERCVRVHGVLLWVRRGYDDSGHLEEIHLLVSAHFHLYVVKLLAPFPKKLVRGHAITAAGPLLDTEPSRLGIHEVEAFWFTASG